MCKIKTIPTIAILTVLLLFVQSCNDQKIKIDLEELDNERVITAADSYMDKEPVTVTAFSCSRSEGDRHDFYSEGDYWWPNPENPDGPYIRKDGNTNPDNFVEHRVAMRNFSVIVASLVAVYELTGNEKYAKQALKHINAWFVNAKTRMNPSLLYAQAIKGRVSGRGIGIVDTIHLIEVAKSISKLNEKGYLTSSNLNLLNDWFDSYKIWLTNHPYGIAERDHGNNHSAWWVAQVAAFSKLTGDTETLNFCRKFYKETILPEQMDAKGRFSDEIKRTKPYSYSLFSLEAFALICELLSTPDDNLWEYTTADGKSIGLAFEFMYPFIHDKTQWPFPPDIAHFDELPVRGSALLFGGLALNKPEYINEWVTLDPDPTTQEIIRTFVIRQPLLWVAN